MKNLLAILCVIGLLGAACAVARAESPAVPPASDEGQQKPAHTGAEIKELIKQLGAEEYEARVKAYEELKAIGKEALPFLKEAVEDKDVEIRTSAKRLVDEIEGGGQAGEGIAQTSVIEEDGENGTRVRYVISEDASGKITVKITKTDKDGKTTEESKEYKSKEEFQKTDPQLYNKYIRSSLFSRVKIIGGIGGVAVPAPGFIGRLGVESLLTLLEKIQALQGNEKILEQLETDFLALMKRFDAVERKFKGRGLKDSLDFGKWELRDACAIPGAKAAPVDDALKSHLKIENGVIVTELEDGSVLAGAGVAKHDIITEFGGQKISDVKSLNEAYKKSEGAKDVEVKIIRAGAAKSLKISLEKKNP